MDAKQIYEKVQECYGLAAKRTGSEYGHTVARAFGYTEVELADIPQDANLGLSCGNPLALAKLREVRQIFFPYAPSSISKYILIDGDRKRQLSISAAAQVSTYFSQQRGSAPMERLLGLI